MTLRPLNELSEAPSESGKICGLQEALEDDEQPASSYKMPVGGALADVLADIDDRVSSPSSCMRSKKVLKLLQHPGVRSRKFYRFQGEEVTKAKVLNHHLTELVGLRSRDNLNKTDFIWSSTEAEDMEAALKSIVEVTLWMDWWTFAMKSLSLKSTNDARFVRRLSLAGARCQLLVAKTTLTLKRCDAVLTKVKDSISFESFMDLRIAKLSSGSDLFPTDVLEKAVEKSSKVLHDETMQKAVSSDKPASKGKKVAFLSTFAPAAAQVVLRVFDRIVLPALL